MQNSNQNFAFGKKNYNYAYNHNRSTAKLRWFYIVFAILLLTNILTLVILFLSPNIKGLLDNKANEVFISYENKISELRAEVDLLYSRQYAQNGNLNLQIQELTQQQAALNELQFFIKKLATKANSLGIDKIASPANKNQNANYDDIITGSINQNENISNDNLSHVLSIKKSLSQMTSESYFAISAISSATKKSTDEILYELRSVGIVPQIPKFDQTSVGGPFLPEGANHLSAIQNNLISKAGGANIALGRFMAAKQAVNMSPLRVPLNSGYRISSPYGGRNDPFLDKRAFHSGTDMAMPWGSPVMSAGDGVVTFAGRKGAYGKTVEIKLDGGLLTRFAHLSSYSVKKGQRVKAGSIVAKVGSTGRSTGSHLHYEVRNENGTLNSTSFIKVSKRLTKFM